MALDHDIKPAFGVMNDELKLAQSNGIILWEKKVSTNLNQADLLISKSKNATRIRLTSLLIKGQPKSGTTAFAAHLASQSKFDFIKMISAKNMVGLHELEKNAIINKIFKDAYKCQSSCIFIDDFERIIDYIDIGPRFSNFVVQTLMTYLKSQPPLVI